jgi:nitrogen fixation/metabolism regulation signal transduction histidine kinase
VTTKKNGVGLGLAIVSKIVDDHHGTLRLEPDDGGACFTIFFPAVEDGGTEKSAVSKRQVISQ